MSPRGQDGMVITQMTHAPARTSLRHLDLTVTSKIQRMKPWEVPKIISSPPSTDSTMTLGIWTVHAHYSIVDSHSRLIHGSQGDVRLTKEDQIL
jgi:hypothetical protein